MTGLAFVLAAMTLLAPKRDHHVLGEAIDRVVSEEGPLFRDDADGRKTRALLVAVAFRESSLRLDIVGDQGRSVCAFQILHGDSSLRTDASACVRTGYRMLKASAKACPAHPIATYAEGPGGCGSERAQRISRDRMAIARWLTQRVVEEKKP